MERSKIVSAAFAAAFFRDFKPLPSIIHAFFEMSSLFLKNFRFFLFLRLKYPETADFSFIFSFPLLVWPNRPNMERSKNVWSTAFAAAGLEIPPFVEYSINADTQPKQNARGNKAEHNTNRCEFIQIYIMTDLIVRIADLLPDDRLSFFFLGLASGAIAGYFVGRYFAEQARLVQADRFAREDRLRAEQKAREKQHKEEQECARMKEQERIRKFALEARKLGLNYEAIDIVRDSKGRYYCPHCFEDKVITHLPPSSNGYLYCPKCGFYFDRDSVE